MNINNEQVDIIDQNTRILYSTAKTKAHQEGLLHKTIIAEVIDDQGNWTLVKQANHKQDAGQYVSPVGGHVSAGETDEEALKREAFEELGLTNIKYKYIGKKIYQRQVIGRNENHYFIIYEIYSDQEIKLNSESISYKKFTNDEIKNLLKKEPKIFGDAFIFVIKQFYSHIFG